MALTFQQPPTSYFSTANHEESNQNLSFQPSLAQDILSPLVWLLRLVVAVDSSLVDGDSCRPKTAIMCANDQPLADTTNDSSPLLCGGLRFSCRQLLVWQVFLDQHQQHSQSFWLFQRSILNLSYEKTLFHAVSKSLLQHGTSVLQISS